MFKSICELVYLFRKNCVIVNITLKKVIELDEK